jgi:hypothetical protein
MVTVLAFATPPAVVTRAASVTAAAHFTKDIS